MQFKISDTGWIAAAAALAGGAAYLFSGRVHTRFTPAKEIVIEQTSEVARLSAGRALAVAGTVALGGWLLARLSQERSSSWSSSSIEETIDVNVPLHTAYNQWTQFEEFPRFMPTVHEVKQLDDQHLHWRANVAGKTKEWDSEITEQIPDQRIAWRSISGPHNSGMVTFDKIGDNRTRVHLQMEYEPESTGEKIGDRLGGVKLTTKGNLKRFKHLVEARGVETGAWRGTVAQH
jgi:uncharacterized membrane protein